MAKRYGRGNADEERLVRLVVDFVNAPSPQGTPAAYERLGFHPFVTDRRYEPKVIDLGACDPDKASEWSETAAQAFAAFPGHLAAAHAEARRAVRWLVEEQGAEATAVALAIRDGLATKIETLLLREGITEARLTFTFAVGRGFQLRAQPILHGAEEALWYGVLLLLDSGRDLARGLTRCQCGRFFWRGTQSGPRRSCSAVCAAARVAAVNVTRQRRWRSRERQRRRSRHRNVVARGRRRARVAFPHSSLALFPIAGHGARG